MKKNRRITEKRLWKMYVVETLMCLGFAAVAGLMCSGILFLGCN